MNIANSTIETVPMTGIQELTIKTGSSKKAIVARPIVCSTPMNEEQISGFVDPDRSTQANDLSSGVRIPTRPARLASELKVVNSRNVEMLQQWEGTVTAISGGEITAIIRDQTNRDLADEELVFDISEVSPDDRPLVRPGSVFYLSVFYENSLGDPKHRVTSLRFRRLTPWSRREIQLAKEAAIRVKSIFINPNQSTSGR